jgi:hypothetical protein
MPPAESSKADKETMAAQARQVIDVFHEISTLLVRFPPSPSLSNLLLSDLADPLCDRMRISIGRRYLFVSR